jgi:hypothetical protein
MKNVTSNVWALSHGTNITSAGTDVLTWNATNQVGIGTTSPATGAPLDVVSTTGGLGIPVLTTAQVQASTPGKAGTLLYNSTLNLVCVSTGTTIQGYARVSGGTTCQ